MLILLVIIELKVINHCNFIIKKRMEIFMVDNTFIYIVFFLMFMVPFIIVISLFFKIIKKLFNIIMRFIEGENYHNHIKQDLIDELVWYSYDTFLSTFKNKGLDGSGIALYRNINSNIIFIDWNDKNIIKHVYRRMTGVLPNKVTNEMIKHIDDYEISIVLINVNYINRDIKMYQRKLDANLVLN